LISKALGYNEVNILVFLDELDQYRGDIESLIDRIHEIHRDDQFPRIKFIITTRMESGFPEKLQISDYVRLLPFNEKQVDELFQRYGLDLKFDKIMKNFCLDQWEIKKPLFCWMFSMVYGKAIYPIKYLSRTLLYQEFIHSVIIGKHLEEAKKYNFYKYYLKEKRILRNIAALKQIYLNGLSRKTLMKKLGSSI